MGDYTVWYANKRKEILSMAQFTLDAPISVLVPNGYLFCNNCGAYEHHPLRWCQRCGKPLHREKNLTIREFITITAHCGSGPVNTVYYRLIGLLNDEDRKLVPKWHKELYDEASAIHDKFGYSSGKVGKLKAEEMLAKLSKEGKLTEVVSPDEH